MTSFKSDILANKIALITGAGGLLGPRHGLALSEVGAKLILIDINKDGLIKAEKLIKSKNKNAIIEKFVVDITKLREIKNLKNSLMKKSIIVDVLINNAAINPKMQKINSEVTGRVEDYDMYEWQKELDVGITGSFICSRIFGQEMAKKGSGVILNISSDLAIRAPDQRVYSPTESFDNITSYKPIGYSIVKTAMIGMTKYLAEYWGYKNVRVNALLPGGVYNKQPKILVDNVKKRTLLNRWANINEYEDAIVFLCSDASAYMTGQSIVMDGGRSV